MIHRLPIRLIAMTGVLFVLTSCGSNSQRGGLEVGKTAPKIEAVGWLNGKPPTAEERKGKVVVVDAWATWCGPCREQAPEMVRIYNKFHSRGVVFIGLTAEGLGAVPKMKRFLSETRITWPNGYGAVRSLRQFEANSIPAVWVIGRDGKVAWNHNSKGTLEDGIEAALATGPQKERE